MLTLTLTKPWILDFAQPETCAVEYAGGKGKSLATLFQHGLPVPAGFVISTEAYQTFVTANNLEQTLVPALAESAGANMPSLERIAANIQAAFMAATLPDDVQTAILAAYAELAPTTSAVAVRSSAVAEDSASASFAGQHESFLEITGDAALVEAIKRCWASLWTARSIAYRQQKGLTTANQALAVVVQHMVPATLAGVLFTCNPLTNNPNECVINSAPGLGEALVSGQVTPEHISINRQNGNIIERQTGESSARLNDAALQALVQLGTQIEQIAGAPQDIEWAYADQQIWIVQARPVTTLTQQSAAMPQAPGDDCWFADEQIPMQPGDLWTRANFGEVLPYPVSPLTLSGFQKWGAHMAATQNDTSAPQLSRRMYGRLYANEGAMRRMIVDLGIPTSLFDASWGSRRPDLPPHGSFRPFRLLKRLPRMLKDMQAATKMPVHPDSKLPMQNAAALKRLQTWHTESAEIDLNDYSDHELWEMLQTRWEARYLQMMQRHNLLSQQSFVAFAMLQSSLRRWLKDTTLAPQLISGLDGVHSALMGVQLRTLAQAFEVHNLTAVLLDNEPENVLKLLQSEPQAQPVLALLEQFLAEYGHHCIAEPELFLPRWIEQPTELLGWLASYVRTQVFAQANPVTVQSEHIRSEVLPKLGIVRRRMFNFLLRKAQNAVRARDNSRSDLARLNLPRRRAYAELGRRWQQQGILHAAADIFFLVHDEITTVFTNPVNQAHIKTLADRAVARRTAYNFWCETPAPDAIDSSGQIVTAPSIEHGSDYLSGLAASPGLVEGPARIIDAPQLVHHIQPGDIVITRATDPSWTPIFPLVKGLVLEIGGQLSHGAIIAREYGVPAVVNVQGAIQHIHDGEWITVDGTNGRVYINPNKNNQSIG